MFPTGFSDALNYSITDLDTYKIHFPENAGFADKILIIAATLLLVICEFKYFNFDIMCSIDNFFTFQDYMMFEIQRNRYWVRSERLKLRSNH